jgi:hypothetical protein
VVRARRILLGIALLAPAAVVPVGAAGTDPAAAAIGDSLAWYLRDDTSGGAPTRIAAFGWNECTPVVGDWDGDGDDTIGAYCGGTWYLRNDATSGGPHLSFTYGTAAYTPVVGDWDGDGDDTVGVLDGGRWHLRNDNSAGPPSTSFDYGADGYLPVVGDWDGDGDDTPGVYIEGTWVLTDQLPGTARTVFGYGTATYRPVAGDWNGDGRDDPGVRDGAWWHLRADRSSGPPTVSTSYGTAAYTATPGDWNGDGRDGIGVVEVPWGASIHPVTAAELGPTWRPGCPVGPSELRRVHVLHLRPDGRTRFGDLVVHRDVAAAVVDAFARIYRSGFPIERIIPMAAFGADDDAAMAANNTSGFNCRAVTGGTAYSHHSYGWAIDINPVQNPYVRGSTVLPPSGARHVSRTPTQGLITGDGPVVVAFAAIGWPWGGDWTSPRDYMHLSLTNR